MKTVRIVPIVIILISSGSLLQRYLALYANEHTRTLPTISLLPPAIFLIYSGVWLVALTPETRTGVILTGVALLCPPTMMLYHMIAIWFEPGPFVLKLCITLSLAAFFALYLPFVWPRWRAWDRRVSNRSLLLAQER